jgi:hypothetical protein
VRENHHWMVNLAPCHKEPVMSMVTSVLDRYVPLTFVVLVGNDDQHTLGFIALSVCVKGRDPIMLTFDTKRLEASVAEQGRRLELALGREGLESRDDLGAPL